MGLQGQMVQVGLLEMTVLQEHQVLMEPLEQVVQVVQVV